MASFTGEGESVLIPGISSVRGLGTELAGKQPLLTSFSDVPGLATELAGKQNLLSSSSDVPGLASELADKQDTLRQQNIDTAPDVYPLLDISLDTVKSLFAGQGIDIAVSSSSGAKNGNLDISQIPRSYISTHATLDSGDITSSDTVVPLNTVRTTTPDFYLNANEVIYSGSTTKTCLITWDEKPFWRPWPRFGLQNMLLRPLRAS